MSFNNRLKDGKVRPNFNTIGVKHCNRVIGSHHKAGKQSVVTEGHAVFT